MVEHHEGAASAAIARYWLQRKPDAFLAVRRVTGDLIGFTCHLRLDAATPADLAADLLEPLFTELHVWRAPDADFEVGGRQYGVFAHDWRVENAEQWLRLKAERAWRMEGTAPRPRPSISV